MDKKEIKRQVVQMLEAGRSKTETFQALSGGAVKDKVLAYWIGSHPDPQLLERHAGKIKVLLGLVYVQALIGLVGGFLLGLTISSGFAIVRGLLAGGVPLLFAWGFYRNSAQTYTVYMLLSISQVPRLFKDYAEDPVAVIIGVVTTLAMVFFVAWVKNLLFPDLGFMGSKKIKGQFVFSN
ncbi:MULTISPECIES: hypothetical protein [unclassified Pseudomonas]|uniref:hypothetical protein n=1 Tax=unclassified Pseudomonas TaxID=196821 RepID=UPI002A369FB5|nr:MULTISPECIES: hypothetical protein [unclassified Pseudomonas]MDX9674126.1 hypothetical protein [Pseudomonas sp. P8_250]WPN37353.1 hypothetical protein QMK53_06830 [Pseudomonas sp. P8_139]WPN40845.1 hypothetical protein QMK55_24545 [Pseudomonas sp. P8_229]